MTGAQRDLRDFVGKAKEAPRDPQVEELLLLYEKRREEIEARLEEFRNIWQHGSDEDLFFEMAFCLCTPQSSALSCDKAVKELRERELLFHGPEEEVLSILDGHGVRFPENKSRWILKARERFISPQTSLRNELKDLAHSPFDLRDWLVREVLGLGLKEASHYARNIGLGEELAILDRHILNNLFRLGVIDLKPKNISRTRYLEIEERLRRFCHSLEVPMGHMDLLLWAKQTGFVFK